MFLCYNKVFSSNLHYAKIKCQVLPILDYKWCHSYMELLFLLAAVHRFIFHLILVTHKITKLKLWVKFFVVCNSLKFQIFLTCLSSPIKYVLLLLFFWTDSVFCCKNHLFEFQLDSFWVSWDFVNVRNLKYSLENGNKILFGVLLTVCMLSLCH